MKPADRMHLTPTETTLRPGVVLWDRLRLERPLVFGRGRFWLVTDLRTAAEHSLELMPAATLDSSAADDLQNQLKASLPASHPNLFRFYRAEGRWPDLAIVAGSHPRLNEGSLAPAAAGRWEISD